MKSLNLCLSLTLLLCLQAYATASQDPLVGTWSKPEKQFDTSSNCCIPDSIQIVKDGSDYKATYEYGSKNGQCITMFSTSKGTIAKFSKASNSDVYDISVKIFSLVENLGVKIDFFGVKDIPVEGFYVRGYLARIIPGPQLRIYNPERKNDKKEVTEPEGQTCNFNMTSFVAGASSSVSDSNTSVPDAGTPAIPVKYIAIGVGVAFLFLCIACKCRQRKQIVIIQHESAYGAPNMYHPHQPHYGQKGPTIQTR
jgi:hypothetical protein